jgi:quinol monooxygenase YgiN
MITMSIKVSVLPEKRKELVQTIRSMMGGIRKEKGCLSHTWYRNIEDDNALILLEEWQTREDLERYLHSYGFRILLGAIRILGDSLEMRSNDSRKDEAIELAGGPPY